MNSFLVRRLAPFFIFTITIELITFFMMGAIRHNVVDWSLWAITDTLGLLILTTFISFLYIMLPYVLYLLVLPPRLVNGKLDRVITIIGFGIYVFITMWEEIFSFIFWQLYGSALDQNAAVYLQYPREALKELYNDFPLVWFGIGVTVSTFAIVWLMKRFLFTKLPMPSFGRKLFYSLVYGALCLLAFWNVDIDKIEKSNNYFNNELAMEGTYSLFRSLWNLRYETLP